MRALVDLEIVSCQECERPWGVILPRGFAEVEELQATLMLQRAYGHVGPEPSLMSVIFISDATMHWLEDLGFEPPEGDTWYELDKCGDLPEWWARGRRRFAMRWNCCHLPQPAIEGASP